jgi:hypothetical protein
MVAANSQWLVPTICCTCNGNNPTVNSVNQIKKLKEKSVREKLWNQATNFGLKLSG